MTNCREGGNRRNSFLSAQSEFDSLVSEPEPLAAGLDSLESVGVGLTEGDALCRSKRGRLGGAIVSPEKRREEAVVDSELEREDKAMSKADLDAEKLHGVLEWILNIQWSNLEVGGSIPINPNFPLDSIGPTSKAFDAYREGSSGRWSPYKKETLIDDVINRVPLNPTGEKLNFENFNETLTEIFKGSFHFPCPSHSHTDGDTDDAQRPGTIRNRNILRNISSIYNKLDPRFLRNNLLADRVLKSIDFNPERFIQLKQCVLDHAVLFLLCPEYFDCNATAEVEKCQVECLVNCGLFGNLEFYQNVLRQLSDSGADGDRFLESYLFGIFERLAGRRLHNYDKWFMSFISNTFAIPKLQELVVKEKYWLDESCPEKLVGWNMPRMTFLGRLMSVCLSDSIRLGDEKEDFVSVADKNFKAHISFTLNTSANIPQIQNQLRSSHTQFIGAVVSLIKLFIKSKGIVKEKTIEWFERFLHGNHKQATLQFRHSLEMLNQTSMQLRPIIYASQGLSPHGFCFNVCFVLLELTKPIGLDKHGLIDASHYARRCLMERERVNDQGGGVFSKSKSFALIAEEPFFKKQVVEEFQVPAITDAPNFSTEIFWLCLRSMRVLMFQCFLSAQAGVTVLSKMVREESVSPPNTSIGKVELLSECLCQNTELLNPDFVVAYTKLLELSCAVFLNAAFKNAPSADTLPLGCALNFNRTGEPSEEMPKEFALLPTTFFSDLFDGFTKFLILAAQPLFASKSSTFCPTVDNSVGNMEVLSAAILFVLMDPRQYIDNPSFRTETAGHFLNAIGLTRRLSERFSNATPTRCLLAKALIVAFSHSQKLSYYMRIEMRLILIREMDGRLGKKADENFIGQLKKVSESEREVYEKFLYFFSSSMSWLLEEALSTLSEIKKRELKNGPESLTGSDGPRQARGRGDGDRDQTGDDNRDGDGDGTGHDGEEQEITEMTNELAEELEGRRNISEIPIEEAVSQCKNLMEAGWISLSVFSRLGDFSMKFIVESELLLQQVTVYLNNCLNSLCGTRCLELKVTNFEKYHFRPREFLACLCQIYLNLFEEDEKSLVEACVAEERFFDLQLFTKCCHITRREGILSKDNHERLLLLTNKLREVHENKSTFDQIDVPDEFMDPILSEIMKDPVLLPTSQQICDRKTIERHLLSDQFDPFNRMPLTKELLIPQDSLKQRIATFLRESRIQNPQAKDPQKP